MNNEPEFGPIYLEKLHDEINSAVREKVILLATVKMMQKQLDDANNLIRTLKENQEPPKVEVDDVQ